MKTNRLLVSLLITVLLIVISPASAQSVKEPTDDSKAYFEVLRSDFNANKIRTYNQVLKLTGSEADVFWPIYREYEKDLAAVGDEKLEMIREFFSYHRTDTLTDEVSKTLAQKWLKNVQARLDLWKKYQKKISKALSPVRAAQFLQIENQMALFVDMEIASNMPLITPGTDK